MPVDPIKEANLRLRAFDREQQALKVEAVRLSSRLAVEQFGAGAADLTPKEREELDNRALRILQERKSNMPDPRQIGLTDTVVPGELSTKLSANALGVLPQNMRPETTLQALGFGAVEDLTEGRDVRLDDAGQLLQLGASAAGALAPELMPLRAGAQAFGNRALQSLSGSMVGAGIAGFAQQQMEKAQQIMDQADALGQERMSRVDAMRQAREVTNVEEQMLRGLGEALLEGTIGGPLVFGPNFARAQFARFAGIGDEAADKIISLASRYNIDVTLQDVASSRIVQRARDTLGKFPIANRPFLDLSRRQAEQVGRAVRSSVDELAPIISEINENVTTPRAQRILESNVRAFNRLENGFSVFKAEADQRYARFRSRARETNTTVGQVNTAFEAMVARRKIRDLPTERSGSAPRPTGLMKQVDKELTRLIQMDANPNLNQFINRGNEIESLISQLSKGSHEARILIGVKQAMEKDIKQNLVGPSDVLRLRDEADSFYSDGLALFSGQAARRVRTVDRSFGRVRLGNVDPATAGAQGIPDPGTSSPNKVIDAMLNTDDVGVVRNLHEMLLRGDRVEGQMNYREIVGIHLNDLMGRHTRDTGGALNARVTDVTKLRREMGLNNKSGAKYLANREKFKLAGVDIDQFDDVLRLADQIFAEGVPDVSTFISRRALLGGFKSGLRSFTPGAPNRFDPNESFAASVVKGAMSTGATLLMLRGGARSLTNPQVLKNYRVLLDPKKSVGARMHAIQRLLVLDSTFLALDAISGGSVSQAQGQVAAGMGDAANALRDRTRSTLFNVVEQPLPEQGQGGVR